MKHKMQPQLLMLGIFTAIAFLAIITLTQSIIWTTNGAWSYRRQITINGLTAMQNDYQDA